MNDDIKTQNVEESDKSRRTLILIMIGVVILSTCALFVLVYTWIQSDQSSLIADYFPSSTPTRRPSNTPEPTRTVAPNLTATQRAWVRPVRPPLLGSAPEAQSALDAGVNYIDAFALVFPDVPSIHQPGDVYIYEVFLSDPEPLLWSYGWCTTTPEILEENFAHIQVQFSINETFVPAGNLTIMDSAREDASPCREYAALVKEWTEGLHHLEIRVTFTQDIDDGWEIYPAGTHTYKYIVTVPS